MREFGAEHFDRYQFQGKHQVMPVSAATQIDWDDYSRSMHTQYKAAPREGTYVPPFATNLPQLRAALKECERRTIASKIFKARSPEVLALKAAVARAGSYLALLAAIAYRAWLLRLDAVSIAADMDLQPTRVRSYLKRIREAARALGFDAGPRHPSFGREYTERERRARLRARQESIRQRLYGSPDYKEDFHCWRCRIQPINEAVSKWFCDDCRDKHNREYRVRYRQTHGLPKNGQRRRSPQTDYRRRRYEAARARHGHTKRGTPEYFARMRAAQQVRRATRRASQHHERKQAA